MVNGFRYYRALESVSIASALSTSLTIYPCQIRVHQRWQSKLQLPTAMKKEWWPATVGSSSHAVTCQHCDTHYFSGPRTRNLPIVGWLLVRRATSSATDSPSSRYHLEIFCASASDDRKSRTGRSRGDVMPYTSRFRTIRNRTLINYEYYLLINQRTAFDLRYFVYL